MPKVLNKLWKIILSFFFPLFIYMKPCKERKEEEEQGSLRRRVNGKRANSNCQTLFYDEVFCFWFCFFFFFFESSDQHIIQFHSFLFPVLSPIFAIFFFFFVGKKGREE